MWSLEDWQQSGMPVSEAVPLGLLALHNALTHACCAVLFTVLTSCVLCMHAILFSLVLALICSYAQASAFPAAWHSVIVSTLGWPTYSHGFGWFVWAWQVSSG